ncbi:hypothetical protein EI94DRAFT_1800123 [Lactarius quietus]|nr:hypothetical protein EI94DRAFT_1800123 [Lactarius quietus]
MLAVSKTDNTDQRALAIGSGGLPLSPSVASLATTDTVGQITAQIFIMKNGGVTAYASDGSLAAVSIPVASESGKLQFLLPIDGIIVSPSNEYCEVSDATAPAGYTEVLAISSGVSNEFSLCESVNSDESFVIFNAEEGSSTEAGYNFATCFGVNIVILPIDQ